MNIEVRQPKYALLDRVFIFKYGKLEEGIITGVENKVYKTSGQSLHYQVSPLSWLEPHVERKQGEPLNLTLSVCGWCLTNENEIFSSREDFLNSVMK